MDEYNKRLALEGQILNILVRYGGETIIAGTPIDFLVEELLIMDRRDFADLFEKMSIEK